MPSETHSESRLFSLDVLRGLDMILLTVVGPLVNSAQDGWECLPGAFVMQFRHAWSGFTLWDIIMPLFIFMCGAAVPYALVKRLEKGCGVFWGHVLARVALLWFLGGLVQGNWIIRPMKAHLKVFCMSLCVVVSAVTAADGCRFK